VRRFGNPSLITLSETDMKLLSQLVLGLALLAGIVAGPALAGANDPLFVNLTTDDGHRANMALDFGKKQLERGHPLTVFLNDKGVFLGSKAKAGQFADQQKAIEGLVTKGAKVIACPFCMKHYGVSDADLLPGIQVGNPELTGGALFQDNTKTMTW
jgi:sulfur relay (sulfurtransferase) complex TusBCD TusD component (DsrE family)